VAELAAAGRSAILIPFPFAADDHQRKNGEAVERGGGGRLLLQADLTPRRLADELIALISEPSLIRRMAIASRQLGYSDAAARVVDFGLSLIADSKRL
jgi:UDP-N-acetylglucosamine--N-acetylmuramyl-(pentapeptide) pyrophosphoryl-undecaprenol N-acetylglucosamine transferase